MRPSPKRELKFLEIIVEITVMAFATQGQRPLCLVVFLVAMVLPMVLKVFLVPETSLLSYSLENRLRSLDDVDGDSIHKCQSNVEVQCNKINVGDSQLSPEVFLENFKIQNDRKRNIHAIVTTIVAITVPLLTFVYAFIFLRERPCPGPDVPKTKKLRRKERILRDLAEYHIPPPKTQNSDSTPQDDKQRECPICLCNFSEGEVVIAAKHCHCSIPRLRPSRTDSSASTDDTNVQPGYYRRYFHEECISKWLSDRKMNPKKLCPCCRQPFFSSNSAPREELQGNR